jgi:hypothetical protein
MTMARAQLVDVSLARWYHCVTRCAVAARSRRRRGVVGRGSCATLGAALPTAIHRSSSDWITLTLKMRLFNWQRLRRAALPDRVLRYAWKILCGYVRSKTAADWIRPAKACCKASRWGVTSNSSRLTGIFKRKAEEHEVVRRLLSRFPRPEPSPPRDNAPSRSRCWRGCGSSW